MDTQKAPRFDIELLTTGHDKAKLEKLLHRVRGLTSSPSEIISSCPCLIATNISGNASKKLKRYLEQIGADVIIRRHNSTPFPQQTASVEPREMQTPQRAPENHFQHNPKISLQQNSSDTPVIPDTPTTKSITLKRSVGELTRALQDKDWTIRKLAMIELGSFPSNGVIRHILDRLKDDVWQVRYTALEVLSATGSESSLKEMTKCVEDDVWHVRYQAVEALSRVESDKSIKPLITALNDENWRVRQRAVQALGDLRSKRALSGLITCLKDDVWHVRESAAKSLGQIRAEKSVKSLIKLLHDPNWHVRSMVVTALWQIGSERAIQALVDVLRDPDWLVHWKAAYALGKIGTTDVLPVLSRMEKETNPFLSELSQKVLTSLDIVADPRRLSVPRLEYCSEDAYANMSYIPAGEFIMGHDNGPDNAQPAHQMYLDGFFIDTYEVTNYQYKRFDPSHEYPLEKELYPVVNVSWEEANAYAEWIGKRLPTEAEWEKAARGNDGKRYPWGDEFDLTRCNSAESGNRRPTPVDDYSTGKSPYGVYDMSGNVLEWTADRYKAYPWSRYDSPDFEEDFIVLRGGSWLHPESNATCSSRLYAPAENKSNFIGFRCVKDIHTLKR